MVVTTLILRPMKSGVPWKTLQSFSHSSCPLAPNRNNYLKITHPGDGEVRGDRPLSLGCSNEAARGGERPRGGRGGCLRHPNNPRF